MLVENEKPSIIFMGTPDFAVASLDAIISSGYTVHALVTAEDKPAGRGRKLRSSPVKEYGLQHKIPILQPAKLKDENFANTLRTYKADLFVVVAFRMLPKMIWEIPPLGTFNLHASLLPAYRGAAPINWAIMNGEEKTGLSTFFIDENIDSGRIIMQEEETIGPDDNAGSLHDKLMNKGAKLVCSTIKKISTQDITPVDQRNFNESMVSQAPKLNKETCRINWQQSAQACHNTIRGLSPYPGAWTVLHNTGQQTVLKIFKSRIVDKTSTTQKAGTIESDNKSYCHIYTSTGIIAIEEIQMEGKRKMEIRSFLQGYSFANDAFVS